MSSAVNKLVCSFKSDLPNEIDFAMQVATVLANSDNFTWSKDYQLVDAICSSLHVYSCICQDDAPSSSCYCYPRFWHKILDDEHANLACLQAATLPPDIEQSYLNFTKLKDHETYDHNRIYKRIKAAAELIKQFSMTCGAKSSTTESESEHLLNNQQNLTNGYPSISQNHQQIQQQPVYQMHQSQSPMQHTLQNSQNSTPIQPTSSGLQIGLSNNVLTTNYISPYNYACTTKKKKFKSSPSLLKFVSLLLVSKDMSLYLIGMDILSNTASKLSKLIDSANNDPDCYTLVQMLQQHCVDNICRPDGDIYVIIRSLEVVSKLLSSSSSRISSAIISHINDSVLLSRIEQLLTSRNDVSLFLAALECCYRISRHQPHLIASGRAQPMTKILVNLLNCEEKQFFTPSALKRIALIGDDESNGWTQLPPPKVLAQKTVDSKRIAQLNQTNSTAPKNNQNNRTTNIIGHSPAKANSLSTQTPTPRSAPLTSHPIPHSTNTNRGSVAKEAHPITNGLATTNGLPNGQTQNQHPEKSNQNTGQSEQQSQKRDEPQSTSTQLPQPSPATQPLQQQQPPPANAVKEYTCEWNNCNLKFTLPKQVYTHVFEVHIGSLEQNELSSCQWTGPDGSGPGCLTKRPKYSLLTHLNDFHCNTAALERSRIRSDPIKPPVHPGYGPNAALLAIKRHANTERNGGKTSANSSPLSVSVRLTAALILRNLATQSAEIKQALGNHEPLLSEICMTNGRDESKIIAECLSLFSSE